MTDATPKRATVEHPFDRQRRAFFGVPALILLAAVFVIGGTFPGEQRQAAARTAAIADYEAALEASDAAFADYRSAASAVESEYDGLLELAALVEPIAGLSGDPIPADAAAALAAARTAAVAIEPPADEPTLAADLPDPATEPPDSLAAWTDRLRGEAEAASSAAAADRETARLAQSAATALGKALGDYVTAVVQRGSALLKEHPRATQDQIDALRSALDALPDAETGALPAVLRSAIAAAGRLG